MYTSNPIHNRVESKTTRNHGGQLQFEVEGNLEGRGIWRGGCGCRRAFGANSGHWGAAEEVVAEDGDGVAKYKLHCNCNVITISNYFRFAEFESEIRMQSRRLS